MQEKDIFKRVPRSDYVQDPFIVAKQVLLGAYLCSDVDGKLTAGKITEVEVYTGGPDKASHTYQNRRTPRTEPMFKMGGHAYIFFTYGMYHQFCVVTSDEQEPNAILIRSVEPLIGLETMKQRRHMDNIKNLTTGPGKLCVAMGITKDFSGIDLLNGPIWISPRSEKITQSDILATPRIGIDSAGEYVHKKWRYVLKNSVFISRK